MKKLVSYSIQEKVYCPVCNANCSNNILSTYKATDTASYFCPPTRNFERYTRLKNAILQLWQADISYLVQCSNCTFAFGFPYIGGNEQFYSILHEQYGYPKWRIDYDIAIDNALILHKGGKILDIGAGTGNFLKSLGQEWDKYAVEGSETTRTLLKKENIHTHLILETLVEKYANQFSVVTMFQVLEHIAEFREFFRNVRCLLKTGGHFVISVPNGEDMILQEEILGCPDYPPNHINKWTKQSLNLLFEENGFKVKRVLKSPNSISELLSAIHVKILDNASRSANSLAAKIYSIKSKKVRVPFITLLAIVEMVKQLPNLRKLYKGRTLIVIAEAI